MKQYSVEELNNIFTAIAPQRGLVVPVSSGAPPTASGPAVCVSLRYSEVVSGTSDVESRYWHLLRQTPVIGGVGMLASVNSILSERRAAHRDVHKILNDRLLTTDLVAKVAANEVGGPGFVGVFTRIGCLQLMRHLLFYGNGSLNAAGQSEKQLGELALLTNEFLQLDAVKNPSQPS